MQTRESMQCSKCITMHPPPIYTWVCCCHAHIIHYRGMWVWIKMPTYGVHQHTNGDGYTHFQENILANCVIKRSSYLKILGQLFSSIAIKCQWLINYFRKVFILFLCKIEKKKLLKYIYVTHLLACLKFHDYAMQGQS